MTKRVKSKGIFCLEGEWWDNITRKSSVEPVLDLLHQWDPYYVPFIRRDIGTVGELRYYIEKWALKSMSRYPILYLAFHGSEGTIYVGDLSKRDAEMTLDVLEELLGGKCKGRIVYFGACSTMKMNGNRLNRFLKNTEALAVCGYTHDVDWLRSSAFEMLALAAMQDNALTVPGARAMNKRIRREAPYLVRQLGFRMVVKRTGG